MKTKWQYYFETHDFVFEREHKFIGKIPKKAVSNVDEGDEEVDFEIKIEPDKELRPSKAKQSGILYITIPYSYEEGKERIDAFLYLLLQRINFDFGEIRVNRGMVMCERLPETPEEKEQVGDAPFAVTINMVEVTDNTRKFDPKIFTERSTLALDIRLVAQHNESRKSQNAIEKFLGFFKILESQFPPQNKKESLQQSLENSTKLFGIYAKSFKFDSEKEAEESFRSFVKSIVHARHRCAHLKADKNFGYLPADPRIKAEVEPFLLPLEILTFETIQAS